MKTLLWMLIILASTNAYANGIYCGHALVTEGDGKFQILQKCGPPDYQESRMEYRSTVIRGSGIYQPGLDIVQQVPVTIELWVYDFGPRRFMQALHFENNQLMRIETLGYGTVNGRE